MSNQISFVGTIGKNAEVRYLQSGAAVLTVSVANNTGYGDRKKTAWFRVSVFGKRAEGEFKTFLTKGQQVYVSGELSVQEYEKDGQTKYSLEVLANILDLVGGKKDQPQATPSQPKSSGYAPKDNFDFDDSIPF